MECMAAVAELQHGATADTCDGRRDVRIGEPGDAILSVLIPLVPRTPSRLPWHGIAWSQSGNSDMIAEDHHLFYECHFASELRPLGRCPSAEKHEGFSS